MKSAPLSSSRPNRKLKATWLEERTQTVRLHRKRLSQVQSPFFSSKKTEPLICFIRRRRRLILASAQPCKSVLAVNNAPTVDPPPRHWSLAVSDHRRPRDNSWLNIERPPAIKTCCSFNPRSTERHTSIFAHTSKRRELVRLPLLLLQPLLTPTTLPPSFPSPPPPVLTCVYSAHPARLLMKPHTSSTLHLLMSSPGFAVAESSPSMKRPPMEPERGSSG